MHSIVKRLRQHAQKASLSQRLILGLVLVVVAVIIFSGVPANIAMWLQLERQVWMRVQDAQAATQALYDAEITRLKKLAGLFAGRPTLFRLAGQGDTAALEPYLNALQEESGNLDVVQVITPAFRAGDQLAGLPDPEIFLAGNEPYFADFVSLGQPARLYIIAVSQIQPSGEDNPLEGYVLLARQLKSDTMLALEQETGLAQSLIVARTRVATSLPGAPDWALDADSALQVENTRQPRFTQGLIQSETYYFGLMPLSDSHGNVVALSEVALAGGVIRRDMLGTTVISAGISLLVMLVGLLLVVRQARTITHPLRQLSQAAERLSQGNLDIPTPVDSGIPEIDQLAQHFDLARRQLRQTLAVTQREMKHAERLLSSVRQGVVALDEEGRITFFNPDAEEILGYRAENVLHHHYSHIFPPAPDETTGMKEILGKLAGDISPQRVNILDARGRPLLLAVHTSLLEGDLPDGSAAERVLVIRDVTEEEAVERLRYNFLANVAHEFRTPLSGIAATSELLVEASYSLTQDELTRLIETIQLSTLHLQTLVNNLLESTTIEAGCFQVHRRPINFLEVAQDAVGMMGPLLNRRDQELVITSPQDVPTLWADNNRLTQVLVNLLSNASKFSPMGGKIELVLSQDSHWLTVTVLDCGPGLPAGLFADLFKRFVTDNQPHETQYGIGLGLSVVKSIVELHGGQVGAENRLDGGAKVWFTIPVQPPEEI
jgi:PAS domain S-box-containing protein